MTTQDLGFRMLEVHVQESWEVARSFAMLIQYHVRVLCVFVKYNTPSLSGPRCWKNATLHHFRDPSAQKMQHSIPFGPIHFRYHRRVTWNLFLGHLGTICVFVWCAWVGVSYMIDDDDDSDADDADDADDDDDDSVYILEQKLHHDRFPCAEKVQHSSTFGPSLLKRCNTPALSGAHCWKNSTLQHFRAVMVEKMQHSTTFGPSMLKRCNTPSLSGLQCWKDATLHHFLARTAHAPSGSDGYSSYFWISGSGGRGTAPSGSDGYSSYFWIFGSRGRAKLHPAPMAIPHILSYLAPMGVLLFFNFF